MTEAIQKHLAEKLLASPGGDGGTAHEHEPATATTPATGQAAGGPPQRSAALDDVKDE